MFFIFCILEVKKIHIPICHTLLLLFYLVEVDEVSKGGMTVLVHTQKAVIVPRSIDKEMLETAGCAIGQCVAPYPVTDPYQERALSSIHKQCLRVLSGDDTFSIDITVNCQ